MIAPLAEISRRFSPFVYGNNNPLRFTDPDGMAGRDEFGNVTFNGYADVGAGGYLTGSVENAQRSSTQTEESNHNDPNITENDTKGLPNISGDMTPVPVPKKGQSQNSSGHNTAQTPHRQNWILRMLRGSALFPGVGMISGGANATNIAVRVLESDADVVIYAAQVGEQKVEVIANVVKEGGKLLMQKTHIQGGGANALGSSYRSILREIFTQIGKLENVQQVVVEPGMRTSGKMIGKVPTPQTINIP